MLPKTIEGNPVNTTLFRVLVDVPTRSYLSSSQCHLRVHYPKKVT
jgi:hypothetical protein